MGTSTLDLEGVALAWSTDLGEKGEDCRPGAPFITFTTEPSVSLRLTNTQPYSALFETQCPILQGDTAVTVAVQLYRFTDPVLGPRAMPDCNSPLAGLTPLTHSDQFSIDLDTQTVKLGGLDLGPGLVYRMK